jgi:SDR family mycofactocin-dependent oxidoreductase
VTDDQQSLRGKVAFISGGARGQGRSHAMALAARGCDIITFDLAAGTGSTLYPPATEQDLAQTVREVEWLDRRIVARVADVRDEQQVAAVLAEGLDRLGRVDIVLANAGIMPTLGRPAAEPQAWHDAIDIMLTGVVHTIEPTLPHLIGQGDGGSIVITSSAAGLKSPGKVAPGRNRGLLGYVAAKHGVVGLMRNYAMSLAEYRIRVNSVHPCGVATPMVENPLFASIARQAPEEYAALQPLLPVSLVECGDVSDAVLYLVCDTGRYITGVTLPVDGGLLLR